MFSFRYTSLVRRNFLRFGKRNGGDGVKIPHIHHGETEEEEENVAPIKHQYSNLVKKNMNLDFP